MNDTHIDKINDAIGTGELLTIIYHGGSQPGTTREIYPIQISGGMVRARCYPSNKVKTFALSKVELCQDQVATPTTFNPDKKHSYSFASISDAYSSLLPRIKAMGWHVVFDSDPAGNHHAIYLHNFFKNGKLRKTPVVSITYDRYSSDLIYCTESNDFIEHEKERVRPYSVGSVTYGKIERAIEHFLGDADIMKPKKSEKT